MSNKNRKPLRNAGERAVQNLSFWVDDLELKAKLKAVAELQGRTLNNYFNVELVPVILEKLTPQWEKLTKEEQKRKIDEYHASALIADLNDRVKRGEMLTEELLKLPEPVLTELKAKQEKRARRKTVLPMAESDTTETPAPAHHIDTQPGTVTPVAPPVAPSGTKPPGLWAKLRGR